MRMSQTARAAGSRRAAIAWAASSRTAAALVVLAAALLLVRAATAEDHAPRGTTADPQGVAHGTAGPASDAGGGTFDGIARSPTPDGGPAARAAVRLPEDAGRVAATEVGPPLEAGAPAATEVGPPLEAEPARATEAGLPPDGGPATLSESGLADGGGEVSAVFGDSGSLVPAPSPRGSFVLRGTVLGPKQGAVAGALIEVMSPSGPQVARATADTQGAFELPPLPEGTYRIVVRHVGFATKSESFDLGPTTTPLSVLLVEEVQEVHVRGKQTAPTGSSVSAVSRHDILTLPGGDAQSLTQVLLTQPGFTTDTYGPDGLFHIRGEEAGVLYVVDGVPIPQGLAGQFVDVLPTALIQSMRLITGGQPVEYGPNVGGVVDVTSRRGTGNPQGAVQMVYGTYQKAQPSVWYSQAFDNIDVFLAGTFLTTQRGLGTPVASPVLHDDLRAGSGFARIAYRLDEDDRVELFARYAQQLFQIPIDPTLLPLSDGPPNATRGDDIYGNTPPPFVPYNANPTEAESDLFVAASYTHDSPGGLLQVAPYIRSSYGNLDCDPSGSLGPTADPGSICSDVTRNLLHEGLNTTYAWKAGDAHHWKVGATFDVSQSRVSYTQFTRDDAAPMGGPDPSLTETGQDNTRFVSGGVFVQDEITLGNLKLLPGLRADVQDASFVDESLPNLVLAGPSARLGLSYALTKDLLLHGFVGYLWQPPNAVDAAVAARILHVAPPGQPLPVDVKAERDEAAELGLSYQIPNRFEGSLTAYGRISQSTIDVQTVGSTDLIEDYNYVRGRAVGAELSVHGVANRYLQGFGNVSWDIDQGQGIGSETYLFLPSQVAYPGWQILDHVQKWTANAGFDLHDEAQASHLAVTFQYGSGLRTGADNVDTVPGHAIWNLTLRHRFDFGLVRPEVAVDIFNAFDAVYAIRIANGYFGSAYGALREVNVRLTVPFGT